MLPPESTRPGPQDGPRTLADCPYRSDPGNLGEVETARCGLLSQIAGAEGPGGIRVGRDACEACCRTPLPSTDRLNQVIASLLFQHAESLPAGSDPGRAEGLKEQAARYLEVEPPADPLPSWPLRALVPCGYFGGPILGDGRASSCRHPEHDGTTTVAGCRRCRDWVEVPGPPPPPLTRILPATATRQGPPVLRWAVGVTTAPRPQATLEWCLDSLARAGWKRPRLFVDGEVSIPRRFGHLPVTRRIPRLGAWPSYYLALGELLMRHPGADAYLMVQDDVLFYDREDLRAYLEAILWPTEPIGAVSLYCPSTYTRPQTGWHEREGAWIYGALAFIFSKASAKDFLADPQVLEHRWGLRNGGKANIDVAVGRWAAGRGLPIYYPTPSLAQHIGETSTLWPEARAIGIRRADWFAGDLP